jgi:hypothetical protein
MAPRFLAFLLFGVLSLVAFDSFDALGNQTTAPSATSGNEISPDVTAMDGVCPYPPGKPKN